MSDADNGGGLDGGRLDGMTDWDRVLYRLARVKASLDQLETRATTFRGDDQLPDEVAAQIQLTTSDFETLTQELIDYQYGDTDLPDECPVCGDPTQPPGDLDVTPGTTLAVKKACVTEVSDADDSWNAILHYSTDAETTPETTTSTTDP